MELDHRGGKRKAFEDSDRAKEDVESLFEQFQVIEPDKSKKVWVHFKRCVEDFSDEARQAHEQRELLLAVFGAFESVMQIILPQIRSNLPEQSIYKQVANIRKVEIASQRALLYSQRSLKRQKRKESDTSAWEPSSKNVLSPSYSYENNAHLSFSYPPASTSEPRRALTTSRTPSFDSDPGSSLSSSSESNNAQSDLASPFSSPSLPAPSFSYPAQPSPPPTWEYESGFISISEMSKMENEGKDVSEYVVPDMSDD